MGQSIWKASPRASPKVRIAFRRRSRVRSIMDFDVGTWDFQIGIRLGSGVRLLFFHFDRKYE